MKYHFQKHKLMSSTLGTIFLFLLIFIAFPAAAAAADAGKGKTPKEPRPVAAVNSHNGSLFPVGKYALIIKHYNFTKDQLYNGDDKIDFNRPQQGQKPKACEQSMQRTEFILRTGIYKNLDARLIIPYIDKELDRKSFNADFTNDNSGLGDLILISRYQIMSQKKGHLNLIAGLGIEMPTGSTDETDNSGKALPGFLQTGSGSWNPMIELGMHKIIKRHWLSSHFAYLLTSEGEQGSNDFEKPDIFKYNFAYSYALSKFFDLGIELNGEVKNKAELNGVTLDNTGGHSIFLSPEIHFKFAKGMHFGLCVPIAVYHDMNGTQLTEDYRVVAKLAYSF